MACFFRDCLAGIIVLAAVAGSADAQSLWIPRDRDGSVTIEALKPSFETVHQDFLSGVLFLDVRHRLGPSIFLVAEVPYARFSGDFDLFIGDPHVSESTLGNIYLGVESSGAGPIFGEFGVRLPTTAEDSYPADDIGFGADVGRLDAFAARYAAVHAAFNLRTVSEAGIVNRWRLGTAVEIPTKKDSFGGQGDPEVFALYAWQTGYEGRVVRVGAAASGTLQVTEDIGNLGARSINQLEFHADFGPGKVRPGVEMKLPLGNVASLVPVVLGASVSVGL